MPMEMEGFSNIYIYIFFELGPLEANLSFGR